VDAKVSEQHRIVTPDVGSRLARLGRGAPRNPLRALLRYVLPLAVGGGLAAAIALVLIDPDGNGFPALRDQDVYPPRAHVQFVLDAGLITAADLPSVFEGQGQGVSLRVKALALENSAIDEVFFVGRGLTPSGARVPLVASAGFTNPNTAEIVFSGVGIHAAVDGPARAVTALAALDDATLFQLIAEPGDRLIARLETPPVAVGDQAISFTFALDRPFGGEYRPLVTSVTIWQRENLLAFGWTTRIDNASPPQIALGPIVTELDRRLAGILAVWENPFVLNASSPAGADRGANQRGA